MGDNVQSTFIWRELFITRKTRSFTEIVFLTQMENTHALGADNWRSTRRNLLHQYFQSFLARSLKQAESDWISLRKEIFLCDLFNLSLFSWCYTNSPMGQPADKNLELSSAFAILEKFGGDPAKRGAKSKKLFECRNLYALFSHV